MWEALKLPGLLGPLEVGGLRLGNRIVMPPMGTNLSTRDGDVTDELIGHYRIHARGLGLLIVEHAYVTIEGKYSERQLGIYSDKLIKGLKRFVETIHSLGTPIALQLNHAGGKARWEAARLQSIAPSPIFISGEGTSKGIDQGDMEAVIEGFSSAAERALRAGFDAVEIHGAHGYPPTSSSPPH
jgi:2,4-dienoyl-CoA reductase-like NADH-dependent reductase (Old Yellow Enzyme family)